MNIYTDIPLIQRVAAELRDYLGEDFDETAFLDTLDGETDALDVADRLIALALDADAMADAIKAQEADLKARRDRKAEQAIAYREKLLTVLDAMGLAKIERPRATVSRRKGMPSVQITDEASIPSQLCKVVSAPDKAAIKAQLMAGVDVPGAAITIGADGITMRVK